MPDWRSITVFFPTPLTFITIHLYLTFGDVLAPVEAGHEVVPGRLGRIHRKIKVQRACRTTIIKLSA